MPPAGHQTCGALLIEVHLLTGRYHGAGDWPPAPFRLFQALVAGAYGGRWADEDRSGKDAAFRWLESLPPPLIAAPARRPGRPVVHYVPNNDLDAKAGDPRRTSEIRAPKRRQPTLLEEPLPGGSRPILYVWPVAGDTGHAARIVALADRLHTLGHGIDAAYASAEMTDWPTAEARLVAHGGTVLRPSGGPGGPDAPQCPVPGSLDSLHARHAERALQFQAQGRGRNRVVSFRRPAKPDCAPMAYDAPPQRLLYELRDAGSPDAFAPWPPARIAALAATARDAAAARLTGALPAEAARIQRLLVGRNAGEADKAQRPRILPLPSRGAVHTDPAIRRLLMEVPPDCPLDARDLAWAFTGLPIADGDGVVRTQLVPADDRSMLRHYGVVVNGVVTGGVMAGGARLWRTVTPVVLPAPRSPDRPTGAPLSGSRRRAAEAEAAAALRQALRHAGLAQGVAGLRVQRDPWSRQGERAERFAEGTRFAPSRLWHAEIRFAAPVAGPLVVGDGRYLGLGLLAPVPEALPERMDYVIDPATRPPAGQAGTVVEALRRALMSLARDGERGAVATLFSGHDGDSGPARSGKHRHLYLTAEDCDGDGRLDRLTAWAPWRVDRSWTPSTTERRAFARITGALSVLRAGRAGVLHLTQCPADATGAEPGARVWVSRTPYLPTRHPKRKTTAAAEIAEDLRLECHRRGLPAPEAEVIRFLSGCSGGSLAVEARLTFAVAVSGPILLGRNAHAGGGLFEPFP